MEVLLISSSRIVKEMVRLAIKRVQGELESVDNISQAKKDRYDFLIVDEPLKRDIEGIKEYLMVDLTIALVSKDEELKDEFDYILRKPFLPTDIVQVLTKCAKESKEIDNSISLEEFMENRGTILDIKEIEEIRSLLEEDNTLTFDEPKEKEQILEVKDIELDELIDKFHSMKSKKLKKLLRGAEITIKIRFPKDSN